MLPQIDTPTFKLTMPSTQKEVVFRCMKVKEEKLLLIAKEGNDPTEILSAIKQVVSNCLLTEGIDAEDLAIFDIEYAFLMLRSHSIGETIETAYIDNEEVTTAMEGKEENADLLAKAQREATRSFTIKLEDVKVVIPESEKEIKVSDKIRILLRYPPASLYSNKEFLSAAGEEALQTLIEKSIDKVYVDKVLAYDGAKAGYEAKDDVRNFIDDLDVKSYNKIKDFFQSLPHLQYTIEYTNKNGTERKIELTNLSDFFPLL